MSDQTDTPKWSSVAPGPYSDQLSIKTGTIKSKHDSHVVTPQNSRQESPSVPSGSKTQRSHLNTLRDSRAGVQLLSSPLLRTQQTYNDATSVRSYGSASSSYTPSSASSLGSSTRIKKCHICSKPPATEFSPPLQQCSSCKRRYHADCHQPPIPLGGSFDDQPPSSWRCGKCIKKHNTLSILVQVPSDPGQTSSQLRQVSPLQALSSARKPHSDKAYPAKRRKINGVTQVYEAFPDQDLINMENAGGRGSYNGDVIPPTMQVADSEGNNPCHSGTPTESPYPHFTKSISDSRIVSKVGTPLPYLPVKRDASHSQKNHRASGLQEALIKRGAEDSHLKHLMEKVGAGQASKDQVEEFKQYFVTLRGPATPQAMASIPDSPEQGSGAASRSHVEVGGTEPIETCHYKHDKSMPFQERFAAQRGFIDPQSNELSPPYSPLPAQQFNRGIPGQADAAIQVDIYPETSDPALDQPIPSEPTPIVESSNDTQVQIDYRLPRDNPVVPLATCSKCQKRVFSGNTMAMGFVLCTACRNSRALFKHVPGLIRRETCSEVVVPESPVASLGYSDAMKHDERLREVDDGPGQSGRTIIISKTNAKEAGNRDNPQKTVSITTTSNQPEASRTPRRSTSPQNISGIKHTPIAPRNRKTKTAATKRSSLPIGQSSIPPSGTRNRLDEEIYGTTSCPSTPACAVVESLERDPDLARIDKENVELEHRRALQVKDREVTQVTETMRKLERKYHREKRASERNIQQAKSERDSMDKRHTKAIQEKELQLQQAGGEICRLKEQHTKALEEKEAELQHAKAEIDRLREKLQARNTNEQGHELRNLRDEIAALKDRLALAEKPNDEWIKYLPTTTNFYEAAPHFHPDVVSFDREAKLKEIEKRPSRKQTFGKRLSNVRKERGLYPHYLAGKQPTKKPSAARTAVAVVMSTDGGKVLELVDQDSGGLAESSEESLSGNEKAMKVFDEMIAVPKNPIPCLVDNQLAWRDGTRDAKGRLPRAKVTYKVGRNVAGQLR